MNLLNRETRKSNKSAFEGFMTAARALMPKRCELCRFFKGAPGSGAPKGWRRCAISGEDKSPLDSCRKFKAA